MHLFSEHAAGPRTKLFKACNGALRFDIQLALFLLPYLVQNVVAYGSDEARSDVQTEVCTCRTQILSAKS